MNHPKLLPLLCSATLFLTGVARADSVAVGSDSAPSAIGQEIFGPALAPPQHHEHTLTPQEQELLAKYDKNGDGRLDSVELDAAHGAAQQQRAGREAMARKLYDTLLEKFDSTKEGKLSADEQKQAMDFLKGNRPRIYTGFVKQFDRNGDGELNEAETAAVFQYLSNLPSGLGKLAPADGAEAAKGMKKSQPDLMNGGPGMTSGGGDAMMGGSDSMSATMAGMDSAAAPVTRPGAAKLSEAKNPMVQLARMYARLLRTFDYENKGSLNVAEQSEALDYLQGHNPEAYARILKRFDSNGDGSIDVDEAAKLFAAMAQASTALAAR